MDVGWDEHMAQKAVEITYFTVISGMKKLATFAVIVVNRQNKHKPCMNCSYYHHIIIIIIILLSSVIVVNRQNKHKPCMNCSYYHHIIIIIIILLSSVIVVNRQNKHKPCMNCSYSYEVMCKLQRWGRLTWSVKNRKQVT